MTSVAEARAAMLASVSAPRTERVALASACGRTLLTPVHAERAQPPFAASAMDGYALRAADTPGRVRIVGESAAGHAYASALNPGEAVRISTGAPAPPGADVVVPQEAARIEGGMLVVDRRKSGEHVREIGVDFAAGALLLRRGIRLDAFGVALAAAAGKADLDVAVRPRLVLLAGGDEIVAPGTPPRPDQVFDSGSHAIAALAEQWGANVRRAPLLPDDAGAVESAMRAAVEKADLVVVLGAASVGPHDHAKPALERLGGRFLVRKVDMRPGKPTWFATAPSALVLGLPGNPASAIVAAWLFLRPLVSALQGGEADVATAAARLARALPANGAREAYLRARFSSDQEGILRAEPWADQDSSLLSPFSQCRALIVRPANAAAASAGDIVQCLQLA